MKQDLILPEYILSRGLGMKDKDFIIGYDINQKPIYKGDKIKTWWSSHTVLYGTIVCDEKGWGIEFENKILPGMYINTKAIEVIKGDIK